MQEMYGEDVITTADKIKRPDPKPIVKEIELVNEFNKRNPFGGGGFVFRGIRALYKGKKGLQEGAIRKKLVKEYKEKGASFDVFKVYDEAKVIANDRKLDIVEDAMTKVDIRRTECIQLMIQMLVLLLLVKHKQ
jgi:hypothetical protein